MNVSKELDVDHIICKYIYDNRKSNLRITDRSGNNINKGLQKNNTSGIIGVSFDIQNQVWRSQVNKNKLHIDLGSFIQKNDAIFARLKAEKKYFGEFAPQQHLYNQYSI